jgi:hypothetical protein
LHEQGFPAVRALTDLPQRLDIHGRGVTWWRELPAHTPASPVEIGSLLRRLHDLPVPDRSRLDLPPTDPFVAMETRIDTLTILDPDDRQWMLDRLTHLRSLYVDLLAGGLHLGWSTVTHGRATSSTPRTAP